MTAEVVAPLTAAEATTLTDQIGRNLTTLADSYERVMPLIKEAIERDAATALGYSGLSEYVSTCFGNSLSRLGIEVRREVVRELTAGGMSNRAAASVTGVSEGTVRNDLRAGAQDYAPVPGGTPESESNVVGLDGKRYTRPEPRPAPSPGPVFTDRRVVSTQLLDRICRLAEPPDSQHREHAAAWAGQINADGTTLPRLDSAIFYLTLLREELAR